MARKPKPFLHQGHYYTTAGGKGWRRLCTEEDGFARACELLGLGKEKKVRALAPVGTAPVADRADTSLTAAAAQYLEHANQYHKQPSGKVSSEPVGIARALRYLLDAAPRELTSTLTKAHLKAAREAMIPTCSRKTCNKHLGRQKRFVKWLLEEEMITEAAASALLLVPTLKAFRSEAAEYDPVTAVSWSDVEKTLRWLPQPWADIILFQWWSGVRPGEACDLEPGQVILNEDGTGLLDFKLRHKGGWRGKTKEVPIGPRSVQVLKPWVESAKSQGRGFVFAATWTKTGDQPRKPTVSVYGKALSRACEKARVDPWHPNQLRHSFATRIRAELGLEAAQHALGHAHADVTQIYAEKSERLAREVAKKLG